MTTAGSPPMTDAQLQGLPQPARRFAITAVLAAMSLVVLDAGMVNVAMPSIADALAAKPGDVVPVVTACQTALVMALLPCAALGERFGNRRVFQIGVCLFVLGSLLCAASASLPWLIAARFLQGLGGAAVMALGIALLRFTVAHDQLGTAVGWNALTVALCSAAAPTIGALVIARADWQWLFLLSVPTGVIALFASRFLPTVAPGVKALDLPSMALNAAGFGLVVLAVEALHHTPLSAPGLGAGAVVAFTLLLRREVKKSAPLFPLDLLRERSFGLSVVASVCCFTGQTAALIALPFYLQHGLGLSPLTVAFYLSPWPIAVAVTAGIAGRLSDRIPTAQLCAFGAALLASGLAAMAVWPLSEALLPLPGLSALCGVGFGLFQVPNNRNMFLNAPPHRSGAAGGMQGTARLTGQLSGALLMTALFVITPFLAAPRWGLALGAGFALASGLVSLIRTSSKEGWRAEVGKPTASPRDSTR
jgi:DHA2 family multidrug resistance protein-like MFS transporter